jgi:hypothetical protein
MSELGQKLTWGGEGSMSAVPPTWDIRRQNGDVRFVPQADSCTAQTASLIGPLVDFALGCNALHFHERAETMSGDIDPRI